VALLPRASLRSVEAGLWTPPLGITLPGVLEDPRGGATRKSRAGTIEFELGATSLLQAGMKGKHMWDVMIPRQALLDTGPGENTYEGWAKVSGIPGFSDNAQIAFTQAVPGPFCIKQIVISVSS
jgi:hypothetical protein